MKNNDYMKETTITITVNKNLLVFLLFLSVGLVCIFMIVFTKASASADETVSTEVIETVEVIESNSFTMIGNMEYIGSNNNSLFVNNNIFYYYRDIVTDAMFVIVSRAGDLSITQIINPETGLPLTYTQYQILERSNY